MKRKGKEGLLSRIVPLEIEFEGLTQDDVDAALLDHVKIPVLFGHVSPETILGDLQSSGIAEQLHERGYRDLRAEIEQLPLAQEGFRLTAQHPAAAERQTLMELRAFWGSLKLPDGEARSACRALVWDWLELKDPMADFPVERPPLPGQTAPGLSMFHALVDVMRGYVAGTDAEALVTIPQYFHNAVLYQKDPGLRYRFLDPLRQGQLVAQMRDLLSAGDLYAASWAFAEDRVEALAPGQDGRLAESWQACPWTPSELVLALTGEVKEILSHEDPQTALGQAFRFRIRDTPHPELEGSFHLAGS